MAKYSVMKQEDALQPMDDDALKLFDSLSENEVIVIDYKKSRNPRFHRRAMAIFRELLAMTDDEHKIGFEPWRKMMTIKAGYFTTIGKVSVNGETSVAVQADSLAFENFDEQEFRQVFNDILTAFAQKYGHELTPEQLSTWSRY